MNKVYVLGYKDKVPVGYTVINTTSKSTNWSKGLSPFYVGKNMKLYDNYKAMNLENAWQFSKVYKSMVDDNNNPTKEYFKWAVKGWKDTFAHRYPMGKGAIPLYSLWNGKKYGYVDARKVIYIPLYAREVVKTSAYKELKNRYDNGEKIALLDFDGYNYVELGYSLYDVVHDDKRKMGHAFVLAMLLEDIIIVNGDKISYNVDKMKMK